MIKIKYCALVFFVLIMITPAYVKAYQRDVYGGIVVPSYQATQRTGYFHAEKINDRWTIFDPLGNPFYYIGIQNIRVPTFHDLGADDDGNDYRDNIMQKYAIGKGPADGFTNWTDRWAYYTRAKMKSWGFTVPGPYSFYPVITDLSYGEPKMGSKSSNKMPYVASFNFSLAAYKAGAKSLGPAESALTFVDPFDPLFAVSTQNLAGTLSSFKDPYLLAIYQGEADELKGISKTHQHLGFQVAAANPTRATSGSVIYSDTKYYAKYALNDFLIERYNTIDALNAAWGTSYTAFNSDGGYGTGTGFMDENGSHLPNYTKTIAQNPGDSAHPAMARDLSDFATLLIRKFYSTVYNEVKKTAPNYMQLSTNFSDAPDFVINGLVDEQGKALADLYDIAWPSYAADYYSVTRRPQIIYVNPFITANNDSPVSLKGVVSSVTPTLGTQRITNGTFDNDLTGWTATNWIYDNGKAKAVPGNSNALTQTLVSGFAGSTTLKLTLTVAGQTAGNITVKLGTLTVSFAGSSNIIANGSYSTYVSAISAQLSINRTVDFNGSIESISLQDVTEARVTCASCNFWWWDGGGGLNYYAPYANKSYLKFSSIPDYIPNSNTIHYTYYFKSFPDAHTMIVLPFNAGSSGKFMDFFKYVNPGDTFARLDAMFWENTPQTQEQRGQLYYDFVNNAAKLNSNGDYFTVGLDFWSWSDNNWSHSSYHEIENYGLVTTKDNAYDGFEAKSKTGVDTYGFPVGGEPGDYGNFLSKVAEANELLYKNFASTMNLKVIDAPSDLSIQ